MVENGGDLSVGEGERFGGGDGVEGEATKEKACHLTNRGLHRCRGTSRHCQQEVIEVFLSLSIRPIKPCYIMDTAPVAAGRNLASKPPGKGLDVVMRGFWARYAFPDPFGVDLVDAVS
jgi:hypothetical protein